MAVVGIRLQNGLVTVYYDPYDVDINADPYPTFKQLRDEAPLYYNDRYDVWALSRHADVEQGLINWQTFSHLAFAFRITPELLGWGILFALLMGVLGGFFPALRAARRPVAPALRGM